MAVFTDRNALSVLLSDCIVSKPNLIDKGIVTSDILFAPVFGRSVNHVMPYDNDYPR